MFLARNLSLSGGAERQLYCLAGQLATMNYRVHLVLFYGGCELEDTLRRQGVVVTVLGKKSRWDMLRFVRKLFAIAREVRPDIVHGYLSIPNVFALLVSRFGGVSAKCVAGLRTSNMQGAQYDWFSRLALWLERVTLPFFDLAIVNSQAGKTFFSRWMPLEKLVYVPNGIDTQRFKPISNAKAALMERIGRRELKAIVIGHVGRLDPMKDHGNLLQAFAIVKQRVIAARLVCVAGEGVSSKAKVEELTAKLGIADCVSWLEPLFDIENCYPAFDVFCLSSVSEGFPNVIGEAMACDVPCVATDAGDCAVVIGDTGCVVPISQPENLAKALINTIDLLPFEVGSRRSRIQQNFSLEALALRTSRVLICLIRGERIPDQELVGP